MWHKIFIDESRIQGGEYSARVFLTQREYISVSNKLLGTEHRRRYILYTDGFTFRKYRKEYGRFGKRRDVFIGEIPVQEVLKLLIDISDTIEEQTTLPKVPDGPRKELVDE